MPHSATAKKSVWKPRFLEELRKNANVSRSAENVGVDRKEVYRERDRSEAFREAWNDALEEGIDYLEEEARRRAYEGTLKPVYQKGEKVGEIREFSDTLMIFLLKGRRPEVYGDRVKQEVTGKGGGPVEHNFTGSFDFAEDIRNLDREIEDAEKPEDPQVEEGGA